jgi:hypothetical protein
MMKGAAVTSQYSCQDGDKVAATFRAFKFKFANKKRSVVWSTARIDFKP